MDVLKRIAEARIREAQTQGEFDDLPERGRRIVLEDLSHVPEDLRMGYTLLKNAGLLPEELELRRETVTLERLVEAATEDEERRSLRKRMNERRLRYRLLMERRTRTAPYSRYAARIRARLGL